MSRPTMTAGVRRRLAPWVALGGVVGWGAGLAAVLTQHPFGPVGITALVVFGTSWITGRVVSRDIAERPAREVDEYESAQRTRARDLGYLLGLGAMLVLFVLLTVGVQLADRGDPGLLRQAPYLVFLAFLLAAATPTFLLAWRTRAQVDDADEVDPVDLDEG